MSHVNQKIKKIKLSKIIIYIKFQTYCMCISIQQSTIINQFQFLSNMKLKNV